MRMRAAFLICVFSHIAVGSRIILVENAPTCFRRVLAGRRTLRSHVRKVVHCDTLDDCRMECATEIRFPCESFNYRLHRSYRGKGLCELMTKPIEAFDIRRDFVDDKDYDFYEVDRNSLEPNCPDTLKGPGQLHSGYLSSKTGGSDSRWADRSDWINKDRYNRRGSGNRYHDPYIPFQIGMSRSDDQRIWGQYGGYYGGYNSYYKDTKDYRESINHWQLAKEGRLHDVKPYGVRPLNMESERHYEKPANFFDYNNLGKSLSGNVPWSQGYGYGSWKKGKWNSSGSTWKGTEYEFSHGFDDRSDNIGARDCSSRRSPGMSLGSGAVRRALFARTVVDCESACFSERNFKCVSYSYRYSNSHGSDNCFLSERPYRGLEMSTDSGSDVYAMPEDQGCVSINYRPWVESECFWHVRSGAAVSDVSARAALTVAGLGACEAECIRANGFFCRGFSFRFDSPTVGDDLDNCILTSSPPTSLEIGRGLRPNPGHELYARGNYGRGCEPALYDNTQHQDSQCYLKYDSASKLTGSAIKGQAKVKDERSCGVACTEAPFRCLSFSFRNTAPPNKDNCFLSEIRLFDLQKGVDYVHSPDDWLFAFDLFNGQCWRRVHGKGEYEVPSPELPHPISPPDSGEQYPSEPEISDGYLPEPPDQIFVSASAPSGPEYKPYLPGHNKPVYKPNYPDKPGFKPGYSVETGHKYEYSSAVNDYKTSYLETTGFKPGFPPETHIQEYEPGHNPNLPPNRPGYPSNVEKPGFLHGIHPLNDRPFVDRDKPGYKPGYITGKPGYIPDRHNVKPIRPQKPVYHGDRGESDLAVSWRHYTVSGFPCRVGTSCAQNHVAGHWACEPEGGEFGSWDYCCAPTHRCGYSEGFHKPWCYVGPERDQWRPCSEKYYPYHQHSEPHPSQGLKERHTKPSRPWSNRPSYNDKPIGPYLSEADKKYWDELYRDGPQAYYDKYGNPLPGYTRVPTAERPYVKYSHNYPQPGGGSWVPVPQLDSNNYRNHVGLGAPRYWPVAYLHKGPPPNVTYFRYNETSTTTELPSRDTPIESRDLTSDISIDTKNDIDKHRDEKKRNISDFNEDNLTTAVESTTTLRTTTTETNPIQEHEEVKMNFSEIDATKSTKGHTFKLIDGIDDKLIDFARSIELFDIEDAKKHDKGCNQKMLEAEERQIEEIGRLLASRRGGKLMMENRSQQDLQARNIAVDKDLVDFNFGNRFPTHERRGVIQKVSKDELERNRNADKSLEVSETTYVRPPRILTTTDNIRKAIVNGKVFYDATVREDKNLTSASTRRSKSLRPLEERGPSVINSSNFGKKKVVIARNVNPVRRVRRVYRKRYNPEEVRKRLLERERNLKENSDSMKY